MIFVKKNDDFSVILNPSCDLVNEKFEYYILAKIIDDNSKKECIRNYDRVASISYPFLKKCNCQIL